MARTSIATEDFTSLTNWTQCGDTGFGSVALSGGKCYAANSNNPNNSSAIRWSGSGTFTDDQYAKMVVTGFTFGTAQNFIGVICRATGADSTRNYYYFYVEANASSSPYPAKLGKFINGTNTVLVNANIAFAEGDTIELEVSGSTLTGMRNGTAIGGVWTTTDSSIASGGKPGVCADGGNASFSTGDNWEGGNLTGTPGLAVTITTPTSATTYNNGNTSTITLGGTSTSATSMTWANDRGGSGSATNTGTSFSTWSITGITLSLGANVITVTAGDGSTTQTDTITVTYTATPTNARGFGTTLGVGATDRIVSALTSHATQRTYATWFYIGTGAGDRLWDKNTGTGAAEQLNLGLGDVRYSRWWNGTERAWSFPVPSVLTWHHLAITYDTGSTANSPLMYLDGVSQTVTLQSAAPTGTVNSNSDAYVIGNRGAGDRLLNGMQQDFAIWNRILSAAEILDLATAAGGYNGKSPLYYPTSLAEYIKLNDSPVTSSVLANPTVTGTAQQTGLAIDFPSGAANWGRLLGMEINRLVRVVG